MDDEVRKLESEIAAKVLLRYHVESVAALIAEATHACHSVVLAGKEIGVSKPAGSAAWLEAFNKFDNALRTVAAIISFFEQQTGVVLAIEALEKKAGKSENDSAH